MKVINYTVYEDNPYQKLLYSALGSRFQLVKGTIDDARALQRGDNVVLFHVHWEEHIVRRAQTASEAKGASAYLIERMQHFVKHGGRILWTVHNQAPHELEHMDRFELVRRHLAQLARRIFIHNLATVSVLDSQVKLDRSKLFYLPHPSYLGVYEDEQITRSRSKAPPEPREVLFFGKIRRYKGVAALLEAITAPDDPVRDIKIRVVGECLPQDDYGEELERHYGGIASVSFELRRVPDAEIPELMRSAYGVVLPYERVLTSGAAHLALTFGVPTVTPDTPAMRELFPSIAHPLLFRAGDSADLRAKLRLLQGLSSEDYGAIVFALLERARYLHPHRVSRLLGDVYETLSV